MVLGSLEGFCFGDQTQAKPLDGCKHIMVRGGGLIPKMAQEIARLLQSGPRHEMWTMGFLKAEGSQVTMGFKTKSWSNDVQWFWWFWIPPILGYLHIANAFLNELVVVITLPWWNQTDTPTWDSMFGISLSFFSSEDLIITSLSQNQLEYKFIGIHLCQENVLYCKWESERHCAPHRLAEGKIYLDCLLLLFIVLAGTCFLFVVVTCCSYGWCSVVYLFVRQMVYRLGILSRRPGVMVPPTFSSKKEGTSSMMWRGHSLRLLVVGKARWMIGLMISFSLYMKNAFSCQIDLLYPTKIYKVSIDSRFGHMPSLLGSRIHARVHTFD